MELDLNLTHVIENLRESFCQYLIDKLQEIIVKLGNQSRYIAMEKYINDNGLVNWIANKNNYITVYDLYRLAVSNLKVKQIDEVNYEIYLDPNQNIPNSYTTLYPIISLLEYGTLSVRKCEILTKCMNMIVESIDIYYSEFLTEANK